MPNKATNVKTVIATNTIDGKAQDMNHIGAVHNGGSTETRHYHPVKMYLELNRLHADAEREQNTAMQEKRITSPSQATNDTTTTTVTRRSARPEDAQDAHHIAQNHGENPDSYRIAFHKASMARWYNEGPDDQPWSPLRIAACAARNRWQLQGQRGHGQCSSVCLGRMRRGFSNDEIKLCLGIELEMSI